MSDRALRFCVGALASVGLLVTGYLTYARYADASITCTTGGCETVQESAYATVAGVPVAVLGLLGYATVLATAFLVSDAARSAGAALALGAFAFSAYLLFLQLTVIDAVCDWCLVSDAIVTTLVPFTLLRLSAAGRRPAR